ncbi:hypothetical protein GLOIN_2v1704762, partial [Rhizophagus irregularis DAOM 181602=DAOM 197198]
MVNVTLVFFSGLLWSCVRILLLEDYLDEKSKVVAFFLPCYLIFIIGFFFSVY